MGCCGSSSTSPGPNHASFAATTAGQAPSAPSVSTPWRVTYSNGAVAWFSSQVQAYAEHAVGGGVAVDYLPGASSSAVVAGGGAGVSP